MTDRTSNPVSKEWRCFHCDEVFTTYATARHHFGREEGAHPACLIKAPGEWALVAALRNAEDQLARYRAEDSDVLRAMHSMTADHQTALRQEEEKGFARGMRDAWSEFKNFHRLLCERFGCVHDDVDWQRDQLSLIEHIAKRLPDETTDVRIDNLTRALHAKQAKIDALMLEFCPGEMSAEQKAEWAKHQKSGSPEEPNGSWPSDDQIADAENKRISQQDCICPRNEKGNIIYKPRV